jgi:hypothetical protein
MQMAKGEIGRALRLARSPHATQKCDSLLFVVAVMMGMGLAGFGGMMMRVMAMARGRMRVMRGFFVIIAFIMLCRFAMMFGGFFMMLSGVVMMIAGRMFVRHDFFPFLAEAFNGSERYLSAATRRIDVGVANGTYIHAATAKIERSATTRNCHECAAWKSSSKLAQKMSGHADALS